MGESVYILRDKRFVIIDHKDKDYIFDLENCFGYGDPNVDFIEFLGEALSTEEVVDKLNSMDEELKRLKESSSSGGVRLYDDKDSVRRINDKNKRMFWVDMEKQNKIFRE